MLLVSDELRTRGHIPWRKIDLRLGSLREIWVATTDARGRPDATPVWFWWDGTSFWFTTKASSRKARNLEREPAIVLLNGDGADPIIIKGDAKVVSEREELDRLDAAYRQKYVDPGSGAQATIFGGVSTRAHRRVTTR
jgi:general stress protein 26